MIDTLKPLSFDHLIRWILSEQKKSGSIFGVRDFYQANPFKTLDFRDEKLETPFGPASGPHTQYAQSLIAAYVAGCRFFELRTLCVRDVKQHHEIDAGSEGYNVEGAVNLSIDEAYEEFVKAWITLKVLAVEFGMGGMDGFIFNMSAGYNYEDITDPEMKAFFSKMKDASDTQIFIECIDYLKKNINMFEKLTLEDIEDFSPNISTAVFLCPALDCPVKEIENMARFIMIDCGLNMAIRLNAALLGYDYCRSTLDSMGYYDIELSRETIDKCIRYYDMVPLINRLMGIANKEGKLFGVKLSGAFPVVDKGDKSKSLKLSGKALFPLSVALAARLSDDFEGRLKIAFSGGVDANNVEDIFEAGIWPITMNTTILKPGGFNRFKQFSYTFNEWTFNDPHGTRTGLLRRISERVKQNNYYTKPVKSDAINKRIAKIPHINCFIAPCVEGCPISQDITTSLSFIEEEKYADALRVLIQKNPLPFTTGSICTHECMNNCTRVYYEKSVKIREANLIAAQNGFDEIIDDIHPKQPVGRRLNVAVVGGGPAGMSVAYFLAKEGHKVTIYCYRSALGGVARHLIPDFRLPSERVEKDAELLRRMKVEVRTGIHIDRLGELEGFDKIVLALGAPIVRTLKISGVEPLTASSFLEDYKKNRGRVSVGKNVAVIGGNNTAVDAARAAKRIKGVENVYIIYRRNRYYMKANDEELQTALSEGIELMELLDPFEYSDGSLKCHTTELGDKDENGRRMPGDTEEVMSIPADTVIAAVGVRVDTGFYKENGIALEPDGRPIVNPKTLESSIPNVFIAGDGRTGAGTVVDAIADARKVADAILHEFKDMVADEGTSYRPSRSRIMESVYMNPGGYRGKKNSDNRLSGLYAKKGILREPHYRNDGGRCLDCSKLCENCVDVCPNRANVEIKIPGNPMPQVIHVDRLCNECGNCDTFCPYDGAPYKEKFTLYDTLEAFHKGKNEGLVFTHDGSAFTIRIAGKGGGVREFSVSRIEAAEFNGINTAVCNLIATIYQDYRYLII